MSQYPQQPVPAYVEPHTHTTPAPQSPPFKPEYDYQQQQQGIPMQPQPQMQYAQPDAQTPGAGGAPRTQYQSATPVQSLGRGPAPVDCPACGQRAMTTIQFETGNSTHAWALGACCCFCLGCIPYLMNSLKDVQHKCGNCGVLLATWHRSGTTEAHLHN